MLWKSIYPDVESLSCFFQTCRTQKARDIVYVILSSEKKNVFAVLAS